MAAQLGENLHVRSNVYHVVGEEIFILLLRSGLQIPQAGGGLFRYLIGGNAAAFQADVFAEDTVEAYRRGFQIGNHTLEHPELPKLSNKEALEQIRSLNRKLNGLGIPGDVMVRPPYGEYTDYLKENLNVPMIGWNVDSEDWRSRDVDKIYEQIVGKSMLELSEDDVLVLLSQTYFFERFILSQL